jgi:hypothetical protein
MLLLALSLRFLPHPAFVSLSTVLKGTSHTSITAIAGGLICKKTKRSNAKTVYVLRAMIFQNMLMPIEQG